LNILRRYFMILARCMIEQRQSPIPGVQTTRNEDVRLPRRDGFFKCSLDEYSGALNE
jgi:hypothetical protein